MSEVRQVSGTRSTSRRDALYDAVIESVGLHGYERASLRDIASRAGMSHAGLLTHFATKESLLLAALEDAETRDREEVESLVASGATDREVIEALMRRTTRDRARSRQWLALVVAASDPDHPAHAYFTARHERFRRQVETVAARPGNRTVGRFDPQTRATLFMAMLDGLRLEWLMSPDADVVSAAGRFTELILVPRGGEPGLGREPGPGRAPAVSEPT